MVKSARERSFAFRLRGMNPLLAGQSVAVSFRKEWKLLAEFGIGNSRPESEIRNHTGWLSLLNDIRTYYQQNPDAD